MSYEDGYPVFNTKGYSISYISHALGYYPRDINKTLDATKSSRGGGGNYLYQIQANTLRFLDMRNTNSKQGIM